MFALSGEIYHVFANSDKHNPVLASKTDAKTMCLLDMISPTICLLEVFGFINQII